PQAFNAPVGCCPTALEGITTFNRIVASIARVEGIIVSESTVFLVLQDVQVGDPCIGLDQGKNGRAGVGEETGYHCYKLCHIPFTDTGCKKVNIILTYCFKEGNL
ncbi:MAG: hypothetical protein ACK559_21585, partial [bacterium]